ncbi:MAG: DUF2817 domain-containing protein [Candidatus Gastranaerophilales bacterium]|nr:DUF2817 domain-containing protein [Candidatus Gastranaerophilales bacterium]
MKILKTTKTLHNNVISLLEFAPEKYEKTVLILGVFHGDEPEGELLINEYLKNIEGKELKNRLLIIPCLNPDGKALNTRQNSNKIDLNRNFPTKNWARTEDAQYFGGEKANSEIETQFVVDVIENCRIDAILTLHTPYKIVNYDGPAKDLAEKISEITGYAVEEDIGYSTPGSFGTYAGKERKIPTITLELPDNEDFPNLWKKNKEIFHFLAQIY